LRASFKTSVLKEQPIKNAVLQPAGRKTARASAKPTGFCKKLLILLIASTARAVRLVIRLVVENQ
jgi:hypothetical protein